MLASTARRARVGVVTAALVLLATTGISAFAAYPPPPNDTATTAEILGAAPVIVTGSNVRGTNSIGTTTLGNLPSVPGPDVFYRFTPTTTGNHWITMIPWVEVPVYASSGGTVPIPNLCVYVLEADSGIFIAGSDANSRDVADTVVATLTAGVEYLIVVDSAEIAPRAQEFEFTLVVTQAPSAGPYHCAAPGFISNTLPTAVVGTLTGASNNITFVPGTGRCAIVDTGPTFLPGPDHVYAFTTGPNPSDAGDYLFSLVPHGQAWNGLLYIVDSCPPFFPFGCLGAASHTSSTLRQSETIVVTLDFDTTYYVVVDSGTLSLPDAKYTLLVDHASNWGITEVEPNNFPFEASPLLPGLHNGGQLVGPGDIDVWTLPLLAGDRLYALFDVGNAALSNIEGTLTILDPFGGVLEFDDDDGEGSVSPIATLNFRTSSFASAVAGVSAQVDGPHYLQVATATGQTLARYGLHYGVQPAGRSPALECEPNDTLDFADTSGKDYFRGTLLTNGDLDHYAFHAEAGERIYLALDGDPERDSGGADPTHPLATDAGLRVFDVDGDVLISSHNDTGLVKPGQAPDYPAEGLVFTAPASGTYVVQVYGARANMFGPGRTYELAIFRDDAAPALLEDRDPVILSIMTDFFNDTLTVTASDNAAGDSGLCSVTLAAGSVNLTLLNVNLSPGDPTSVFQIGLLDPGISGAGKLIITDCAGNTASAAVAIDADQPACGGTVQVSGRRTFFSSHPPLHAPDNQPAGPGVSGDLRINATGLIQDVDVTVTVETSRVPDVRCYLIHPDGTPIALTINRGSSSAFNLTDATFDDDAAAILSILSGDEPYTGRWRPQEAGGLALLNGREVFGTWLLNVIDSTNSNTGGSNLIRWSLDIDAGFPNPEYFAGFAEDNTGLASIQLNNADNVVLELSADFQPGDTSVAYFVRLVNPSQNGSGTIIVTDLSQNTCETPVSLAGLPDNEVPENDGRVTRDITLGAEVQLEVGSFDPIGVPSLVNVSDNVAVSEVIVDLMINTRDIGRLAATLTHDDAMAALLNRVGMTERGSVGLTKDNIWVLLDDNAPVEDDAHLEPALGSIEFFGLHQPDGRGDYIGDGISSDPRDNMLFVFEGRPSAGLWELHVGDYREQGTTRSIFRRWTATLITPGAPERYVGTARDRYPQAGICEVRIGPGSTNLLAQANFAPGAAEVDYVISLADPTQPGSGTFELVDCAGNVRAIPLTLAPQTADQNPPVVTGVVNPVTQLFEGFASDDAPGDSNIAAIELAPWSSNLQLLSVTPDGQGNAHFVVGRPDPNANGRGYVRVRDAIGFRRHMLVHIDATAPVCTGSIGPTKRYISTHGPLTIPDNDTGGVNSDIVVPDVDQVTDLDLTLNITHGFDGDIRATLLSPAFITLFNGIGSTGNDFIDTTLDDEAPLAINAGTAPFTGHWQPQAPATLSILDGNPAAGTYTLNIADTRVFNRGTFDSWSVTITSPTFPERYDGRAEDSEQWATGLCTIELAADAQNLALHVDPFEPGAAIVRYSVALANPRLPGLGTVLVSDCAGNFCVVPICLQPAIPPLLGDFNGDSAVTPADFGGFSTSFTGPDFGGFEPCDPRRVGDFDFDGDVDLADLALFQAQVQP